MALPHPIAYQGSKRRIASEILGFFPPDLDRLVEPFAGSAAITIAAAHKGKAKRFLINDLNVPLMELWREIIYAPERVASSYELLWNSQSGSERKYYDLVRDEFNRTHEPSHLLYLLARCVKAAVRYNSKGEFNQGPDNRRRGRNPERMRREILAVADLLRDRVQIESVDFMEILGSVTSTDLVYMDPPYQGVSRDRDHRYLEHVDFKRFAQGLKVLNDREVPFIVSYDGFTGSKSYGKSLPSSLELVHLVIDAGTSSQATLLGRNARTLESLYLSPFLIRQLKRHNLMCSLKSSEQPTLEDFA